MTERIGRETGMGNPYRSREEVLRARRARRIRELRRRRKRQAMILWAVVTMIAVIAVILVMVGVTRKKREKKPEEDRITEEVQDSEKTEKTEGRGILRAAGADAVWKLHAETGIGSEAGDQEGTESGSSTEPRVYSYPEEGNSLEPGEDVRSTNAILVDMDNGSVLACRGEKERIVPASMTKILTLLVAAEHIEQPEDTFTITIEITDYSYRNDCSAAGFSVDETVTIEDLMYGTILPSGADAALGLATYVAGSQEAFVELMNQKLEALGLSETTHFTNCVGLYDVNHYTTAYDMAVIMNAVMENELCRKVMSAHTYTTSATEQHPEGIELSNWFLRRIEDKDTGGEVVCGKTGYVVQSGHCAVSYAVDHSGRNYICVTVNGGSNWYCIYDHVRLYKRFSEAGTEEEL